MFLKEIMLFNIILNIITNFAQSAGAVKYTDCKTVSPPPTTSVLI